MLLSASLVSNLNYLLICLRSHCSIELVGSCSIALLASIVELWLDCQQSVIQLLLSGLFDTLMLTELNNNDFNGEMSSAYSDFDIKLCARRM
jgi:hypothetical protein